MIKLMSIMTQGHKGLKPLITLAGYLKNSSIEKGLMEMVDFRVSQINKCAYCLDMHSKEALADGESAQRLFGLTAWKESPFYTDREKAALAWTEAVTNTDVSEEVYEMATEQFTDEELIDLTLGIVAINTWNRLNLAFPNEVGSYRVGQYG